MASPISSCSSDVDAAETFAASLMSQIDGESVTNMVTVQRDMLSRFEKTNEMLINFNILSANRFAVTSAQFKRNTQLMYDMKKDLDAIFKRIRTIKHKLGKVYPEAFSASGTSAPLLEDEEGELIAANNSLPVTKYRDRNNSTTAQGLPGADNSATDESHLGASNSSKQMAQEVASEPGDSGK